MTSTRFREIFRGRYDGGVAALERVFARWFGRVADRVGPFRDFLNGLPADKDILIVGHSGFYKKFLGQDQKMNNCEVVTRGIDGEPEKWDPKAKELAMDPMQFLTSFV